MPLVNLLWLSYLNKSSVLIMKIVSLNLTRVKYQQKHGMDLLQDCNICNLYAPSKFLTPTILQMRINIILLLMWFPWYHSMCLSDKSYATISKFWTMKSRIEWIGEWGESKVGEEEHRPGRVERPKKYYEQHRAKNVRRK